MAEGAFLNASLTRRQEKLIWLSLFAWALGISAISAHHIELNITVPEYKVDQEDAYLCVAARLPPNPHKLVGVIPHARQEVVHHILLYGCDEPHTRPQDGQQEVAWRCDMQPVCGGPSSTIMYGWGKNAPDLLLPEGVGFSVGRGTGIKYIVAQVHYLAIRPPGDHSGVTLILKPHAVPYAAGLVSYASWFSIPPKQPSHKIVNTCCFKSFQPLTMFAVRVHTHSLGRNVYMTRRTWNGTGDETLVSRDPQLPQSFVPTARHMLWPGDRLTVTCDFDSTSRNEVTNAGGTHKDEMCNMYVMVYGKTPYMTMCENDVQDISDHSPGALPKLAFLQLDPTPIWQPPQPAGIPGDAAGPFGDATSVTTGPDGTLWVLYRASGVWQGDTFDSAYRITRTAAVPEAVVAQLDPDSGAVLRRWGAGVFYLPHMLTLDVAGNVWVVDTGRHQVLKFSPDGSLLLEVGTKLQPGAGKTHFCQPTQVSVLRDGSFVVADGYCNNRVVKFDANGKYVAASPAGAVSAVVHSALVDECEGAVYAASREAARVVVLDLASLAPTTQYDLGALGHGQVWALRMGPYGEQLALAWQAGQDARLVNVRFPTQFWRLPGTAATSPHDFVLGGAPTQLSGPGDRMYAVYVAPVGMACDKACGPLQKWVLVPPGSTLPSKEELALSLAASSPAQEVHPGDAVLLPAGTVTSAHEAHTPLAGVAAAAQEGRDSGGSLPPVAAAVNKTEGGGAMVADDYDDVEDDKVSADDYEKEKELEKAGKKVAEDYEATLTGIRAPAAAPPPPDLESFSVIMQDRESVRQQTAVTSWHVIAIVVIAVVMAVGVAKYSVSLLSAYLVPGGRGAGDANGGVETGGGEVGDPTPATGPAGRRGKTWGVWAAAEHLMTRFQRKETAAGRANGAAGSRRYASEVEVARERERLLRSGP